MDLFPSYNDANVKVEGVSAFLHAYTKKMGQVGPLGCSVAFVRTIAKQTPLEEALEAWEKGKKACEADKEKKKKTGEHYCTYCYTAMPDEKQYPAIITPERLVEEAFSPYKEKGRGLVLAVISEDSTDAAAELKKLGFQPIVSFQSRYPYKTQKLVLWGFGKNVTPVMP